MQIGGDNFILDDDLHQKIKTFPFLIKNQEIKINFPKMRQNQENQGWWRPCNH